MLTHIFLYLPRLLTPSSASRTNMSSEYCQLFDAFIDTLASLMDVETVEKSSIQELWNSTGEAVTQETDLNEFVRDTYLAIVSYAFVLVSSPTSSKRR